MAAGGAAALTAEPAEAAGPSSLDGPFQSQLSPISSTIASPRRDFIVYRTLGEWDFSVEAVSANRTFGGKGVHSTGAQTSLWATIDVPGGVILDDVEFYVFNNTGSTIYAGVWLWSASDGYLSSQLLSIQIPSTNSLTATRASFGSAVNGPYPTGTKLFFTVYTPTTGTLQINGVRLGMRGGGAVSVRTAPARSYDSRTETKLAAGETRTIQVQSVYAREGTVGVLAHITVIDPVSAGNVAVYPATEAAPDAGRLHHPASGLHVFNPTIALPVSRRLKIYSQRSAHVVVDILGTVS